MAQSLQEVTAIHTPPLLAFGTGECCVRAQRTPDPCLRLPRFSWQAALWGGTAAGRSWDNPSGSRFFPKTVLATVKMQSEYLHHPKLHVVTERQWNTDSKGIRHIPKLSTVTLQISVSAINRLPILAETYRKLINSFLSS